MNQYERANLTPSAGANARRTSTVRIPSTAWMKTLQVSPETASAIASKSALASVEKLPGPPRASTRIVGHGSLGQHTQRSEGDSGAARRLRRVAPKGDALFAVVVVGGLLMVLAWAVTEIELFALIAVLIAAGSATVAFAGAASRRPPAMQLGLPRKKTNGRGNFFVRRRARSAYDGLAD